jgi:PEP-CTERM motif
MRTILSLGLLSLGAISMSQTFFDDFNRADGALGANYNTLSGVPTIQGNAVGGTAANGLTLVSAANFSAAYNLQEVSADVRLLDTSATTFYAALSLGSDGTTTASHGVFVKLQKQIAGGNFSHIGFYTGAGSNTTAITTPGTGGNFQTLATPFAAARFRIKMTSLTNLYTGIDTNFDSVDDITFNSTLNFPTMIVGNRAGLHVFGNTGRLDNYRATAVPEPATMAALGLGIAAMIRRRRKA